MSKIRKTLLYYDISEKIKDYIVSEKVQIGSLLPSERDLSKKFNVACITLRKSLECLCAEGILIKIPRKGSRIVALPKTKKTPYGKKRIGISIWLEAGINHPGTLNAIEILGKEFPSDEYEIIIIYISTSMLRNNDWGVLLNNNVDGLLIPVQEIPEYVLRKIQSSKQPAVFINHNNLNSCVWCDEESGMSKLFNYLSSLGHRNIAFVTGQAGLPVTERQVQAFKNCCKTKGLKSSDKYLLTGSYDERSGYQKTLELLNMDTPPSAILLGDDFMALGALKAINEKGLKCPDDISVSCFGGYKISEQLHPSLTVLKSEGAFSSAAKMLKRILESKDLIPEASIILDKELIVRESTGLAKKDRKTQSPG
ncbi:MAG: hypothetical protein A2017_00580 [Lentisphaerae bacterium GWF2_44_16]|nr:MAG: hypothetical protein A2017_00580 [Lentisphaerae bacterium GWF2_44_16]